MEEDTGTKKRDPYKKIRGVMPKFPDIVKWTPEWVRDFFIFMDIFFNEEGRMVVNMDTLKACEQYADSSEFIKEMLIRIDQPSDMEDWNRSLVYGRILSIYRTTRKTIEKKPEMVLPTIVQQSYSKPQYQWLKNFYYENGNVKPTEVHLTTVPPDTRKPKLVGLQQTVVTDVPAGRLHEAVEKVIDVYNEIVDSIKEADIRKMTVKDKIAALNKLSYIHSASKKSVSKSTKLLAMNPKQASKEELESTLLGINDDSEE